LFHHFIAAGAQLLFKATEYRIFFPVLWRKNVQLREITIFTAPVKGKNHSNILYSASSTPSLSGQYAKACSDSCP
jgi:hypothetical protein